MVSTLRRGIINSILDLIYPPRCARCGRVDTKWCNTCDLKLRNVPLDLHKRDLPPLVASVSTGIHEGYLQEAIHALKYAGAIETAPALGDRLLSALENCQWSFDLIIPVPLFTLRLKQRGYNQIQVVGSHMAQFMAQPVVSTALERLRNTPTQVGLSHNERLQNVHGAFRANPPIVSNTTILLLDDVMTTGSTLQECAHALLDAGARSVMSMTITAALL